MWFGLIVLILVVGLSTNSASADISATEHWPYMWGEAVDVDLIDDH